VSEDKRMRLPDNPFIEKPPGSWAEFMNYCSFMRSFLDHFKDQIRRLMGAKLTLKDSTILRDIYPKSPSDEFKKRENQNYFRSNFNAFYNVFGEILEKINIQAPPKSKGILKLMIQNYSYLFNCAYLDSKVCINEYFTKVKKEDPPFPVWPSDIQQTVSLYHACNQIIYGQASYNSYSDIDGRNAIILIRALIELRLKRGVAVFAVIDQDKKFAIPFRMGNLLSVYKRFVRDEKIQLAIPFSDVVQIYKWSNMYLHSGVGRIYVWLPIFALGYLRPLILGIGFVDRNFNIYSGIRIDKKDLEHFHREFLIELSKSSKKKYNYEIMKFDNAACVNRNWPQD